jgi:hypothetical protein
MQKSPFHRYHLFRNPFGELTREERADLAVADIGPCLNLLTNQSSVVQFVGECGRGKTTHLLALAKQLPTARFIYIPENGPSPPLPDSRPLIVDEAQRLSNWQRNQLARAGGPLVLGSHCDHTQQFQSHGLTVHTVFVAELVTPSAIFTILNHRIEASRHQLGQVPSISMPFAVRLFEQFGSDMRGIEHYLYSQFQAYALEQRPWPPAE